MYQNTSQKRHLNYKSCCCILTLSIPGWVIQPSTEVEQKSCFPVNTVAVSWAALWVVAKTSQLNITESKTGFLALN